MGGGLQFGRGEVGWEKRRRRNRGRERRQMGWVFNGFFRWNHRRINSVDDSIGDSVGDSAMSLYGYLSLNPSVIPSVKSSKKTPCHHVVASFQTNCILHRRNGRYIPTDFETELFPSIILLVFSGFLVVN